MLEIIMFTSSQTCLNTLKFCASQIMHKINIIMKAMTEGGRAACGVEDQILESVTIVGLTPVAHQIALADR